MAETHATERVGLKCLETWLTRQGRKFEASDKKTFDLIVDGKYAELKTKRRPYQNFDFFYMTSNQFKAISDGPPFTLFLVCNVDNPEKAEIYEFTSELLATEEPKCEVKYYWDKGIVERLFKKST